jgi:hypothetical protein
MRLTSPEDESTTNTERIKCINSHQFLSNSDVIAQLFSSPGSKVLAIVSQEVVFLGDLKSVSFKIIFSLISSKETAGLPRFLWFLFVTYTYSPACCILLLIFQQFFKKLDHSLIIKHILRFQNRLDKTLGKKARGR